MTTPSDIDIRGYEAARAARVAVAPVVQHARSPRSARTSAARIACGATALVLTAALAVVAARQLRPTTVSTRPASPPSMPIPPPPVLSPPGEKITSGQTTAGETWSLFIGGPSNDLCLSVAAAGDPTIGPTVCAGHAPDLPPGDPYRPHANGDLRVTPMLFGRVATGVVAVEVVYEDGRTLGPYPVLEVSGGRYYVIERPDRITPDAVIAHRADGSSLRYPARS